MLKTIIDKLKCRLGFHAKIDTWYNGTLDDGAVITHFIMCPICQRFSPTYIIDKPPTNSVFAGISRSTYRAWGKGDGVEMRNIFTPRLSEHSDDRVTMYVSDEGLYLLFNI